MMDTPKTSLSYEIQIVSKWVSLPDTLWTQMLENIQQGNKDPAENLAAIILAAKTAAAFDMHHEKKDVRKTAEDYIQQAMNGDRETQLLILRNAKNDTKMSDALVLKECAGALWVLGKAEEPALIEHQEASPPSFASRCLTRLRCAASGMRH